MARSWMYLGRSQCGRVDKGQPQLMQNVQKALIFAGLPLWLRDQCPEGCPTLQHLCHQLYHSEGFIGGIFPLMSSLSGSIWNLKMLPYAKEKHFIKNVLCSKHLKRISINNKKKKRFQRVENIFFSQKLKHIGKLVLSQVPNSRAAVTSRQGQ